MEKPRPAVPGSTDGLGLERELERLHPACFAWARACGRGDREEALDVLQTAYLRVLEGRARFRGRSSLKTWLFGVIRNVADERRRRERWRRALLLKWWQARPAPPQNGPEEHAVGMERAARIRAALAALSPRQRQVLELVFFQDVSVREAGAILGISEGSAITHYARAKRILARRLDAEGKR